ncbi:YqaA family protein [Legionella oakridgensis]|nr:YqaA family protein [Legionella oakridgensis]
MKLFSLLYDKTLRWSGHRHAPYYLAGVSFAESSFFPIPPDVMLISMGLAAPKRAWYYALITTFFSVLGGILGYLIGMYAMELLEPYLASSSYMSSFNQVAHWFKQHGVWVVILAGFTPFPYKVFTIAAGAMQMAFLPFVLGSIIGRGLRFFLVSAILYFAGARIETRLRHYIDVIGWSTIVIFVMVYFLIKWMS